MNLLCWNCRGLRNPQVVRSLIELVRLKKPKVVFLCETLLDRRSTERAKRRLGFQHCFTVERNGRNGGLAMMWDQQLQLHLQSYSANHIDMEVVGVVQDKWHFTGFYGFPERQNRRKSWALI
ncbi:hypothetical protein SLE2022_389310 [Rubroshorea leprosula]